MGTTGWLVRPSWERRRVWAPGHAACLPSLGSWREGLEAHSVSTARMRAALDRACFSEAEVVDGCG